MSEGLVRYDVRDRVAVITIDNPPVNALGAGVPEAISESVERACDATGFTRVTDGRFKGGWTTRHYGRPQDGIDAIQMAMPVFARLGVIMGEPIISRFQANTIKDVIGVEGLHFDELTAANHIYEVCIIERQLIFLLAKFSRLYGEKAAAVTVMLQLCRDCHQCITANRFAAI